MAALSGVALVARRGLGGAAARGQMLEQIPLFARRTAGGEAAAPAATTSLAATAPVGSSASAWHARRRALHQMRDHALPHNGHRGAYTLQLQHIAAGPPIPTTALANIVRSSTRAASAKTKRAGNAAVADGPSIDTSRVRNIGVMAHIDAGKTTTTERMLFYAGATRSVGEVDHGNTQMDFMEEERARGITIASAATTFHWDDHKVNLIDTPGHVDFTLEVERALRVLDGAVVVLDAVSGVQAQTITVWKQARKFNVPAVAFVNKYDREGADLAKTLASMESKLQTTPLCLQLAVGAGHSFSGVVDVIRMAQLTWGQGQPADHGREWSTEAVDESHPQYEAAVEARAVLLDRLADLDDEFAEAVLEDEGFDPATFPTAPITAALRRATLACKGVPVLVGASRRDKGVQPLLDAVVTYLPSPLDEPPVRLVGGERTASNPLLLAPEASEPLCALAFKVVHDAHRGDVTFMRVYSGSLRVRQTVVNTVRRTKERVTRLFEVYADSHKEIEEASAGSIVAVAGFKDTFTGDTLVSPQDKALARLRLQGIDIPQTVFSCSIESESAAQEAAFASALKSIQKEDPSVRVHVDKDSGQTILSGMGELHLEIVISRLLSHYNVACTTGEVEVAYRERPATATRIVHTLDRMLSGKHQNVTLTLDIEPALGCGQPVFAYDAEAISEHSGDGEHSSDTRDAKGADKVVVVTAEHLKAVEDGVLAACTRGDELGFPLMDARITLVGIEIHDETAPAAATLCAAEGMRKALAAAGTSVLQPVMALEVSIDEEHVGAVLNDLSSMRFGTVRGVEVMGDVSVVVAEVPLATMVGYASALRSLTSGRGTFTMHYSRHEELSGAELAALRTSLDI